MRKYGGECQLISGAYSEDESSRGSKMLAHHCSLTKNNNSCESIKDVNIFLEISFISI